MCHSRGLNNRINKLHERALRIVYQEKKRDFELYLKMKSLIKICAKNLHYIVTEFYKVENNISPDIMRDIFYF